ncbi:MAG: flagellar biosynthesis protein FlhB [Planctomycetota bacterium]
MAEDAENRTEQPTQRRREEAREEGQIARSTDLVAAIALFAALLLLKLLGPGMLGRLLALTRSLGEAPSLRPDGLGPWLLRTARLAAEVLGPFLALLVVVTIAATAAQSGMLLTFKKLVPRADRLDPVAGLKRLASGEVLSRFALGLLKVAAVAGLAYFTFAGQLGRVLVAGAVEPQALFGVGAEAVYDLALRLAAALLVLGLVDYAITRWRHERQLRMTKQEVREELKKMEGDPLIRQRRRQLQMKLALQRIQAEVPRADVVVTNPTHYAVALRYEPQQMTAPRLTAKGRDRLAERIRRLATEHGVPLVERPPLARALYAGVEVGHEVPPAFYRAVAEVLAYVYQLAGRKAG